jgi:pyruvate formate lyase activating enzyme
MKSIPIKGFIPVTLLDWPGKITAMVFVGGCNFRCPFCYNIDLVLSPEKLPSISEEEIFEFLKKKKKWLDGLIISGGEPTLYPEGLINFCQKVKDLGFKIQIQTNGTNPELLDKLIKQNLVDYIAMDIKGPLEKYDKIVGTKVDKEKIQKSVNLISRCVRNKQIEAEFRTTVVPGLLDKKDIEAIGKWLINSNLTFAQRASAAKAESQISNLTYFLAISFISSNSSLG